MNIKSIIVSGLVLSLCLIGGCVHNPKDLGSETDVCNYCTVEKEDGNVWIYPDGPDYVDEELGVTMELPSEYWDYILLHKPDKQILIVYYKEVKEEYPMLTNGASLATLNVIDKSEEDSFGWLTDETLFRETKTKKYFLSIGARDILTPVSDPDMLEEISQYFEENKEDIFIITE